MRLPVHHVGKIGLRGGPPPPLAWRQAFLSRGFTLVEVMVAMVILLIELAAVTGLIHGSIQGLEQGTKGTRALALVESKIETKRTVPWRDLLHDDTSGDGTMDLHMRDNGRSGDKRAGDGIYTGQSVHGGITLTWHVQPDRRGDLRSSGMAVITAQAAFHGTSNATQVIRVETIRANPTYTGFAD